MAEDRLDKIERILERVAKEQELFAIDMRQLREFQAQTEQEIRQLKESQAETDRIIRESQAKTEEEIRQLRASQAETDKYIKNLGKTVGDLSDGWGKFVLGLFLPSIEDCLRELGFEVISIDAPSRRRIGKEEYEIDILVITQYNGKPQALVIEVKSSVNQQKIESFIKKLSNFREFFFEFKGIEVIGGVAGVNFAKGSKEFVLNNGLYIFGTSKGMMKNLTPAGFNPKIW